MAARQSRTGYLFPLFLLLCAFMLTAMPLPSSVAPFKPEWVAGLLLYWSVVDPRRCGLITTFLIGLVLDVLTGTLLGQNALALILIIYLSQRFHFRIRVFPVSQLAATMVLLLGLHQFVLFWVDGIAGRAVPAVGRIGPILITACMLALVLALFERGQLDSSTRVEALR